MMTFLSGYLIEQMDKAEHPIHLISDHTETTKLEPKIQNIKDLMTYARPFFTHHNLGLVVGFENRFIKFAASLTGQLSSKDDTYQDAINYVCHNDSVVAKAIKSS